LVELIVHFLIILNFVSDCFDVDEIGLVLGYPFSYFAWLCKLILVESTGAGAQISYFHCSSGAEIEKQSEAK